MWILISVLIGALAGFIAGHIMKGKGFGIFANILLGIVGGFVGNRLFEFIGLRTESMVGQLIAAVTGAVIIIWLVQRIRK